MKYRTVAIIPTQTLTGAQTLTIPINLKDIISRLTIFWSVTKVKVGMSSYPHRDIQKIELVDGSDVLFSMDGGQAAALNIYNRKAHTYWCGVSINGNPIQSWYSIDFGRWLFDEMLALDPSRFLNLQLKVTVDPAVCEVGCASGDISLYADVFDEQVPTPSGFLMSKEHFSSITPDTNAYTYIDLPTDFPIRHMLIQGYRTAKEPWFQVAEARLDEENLKRIPFDWALERYHLMRRTIEMPIQEQISSQTNQTPGLALYCTPTNYWNIFNGQSLAAHATLHYPVVSPGGYFLPVISAGTTYVAIVKGWLPNHCFSFPFGYQADISDWYDVTKLGHVGLRLRAGTHAADSEQAVVLQQNRSY